MSDVICAMGFIYTMWLFDTVLCIQFDIDVLSFDLELVTSQNETGNIVNVLKTWGNNKENKKRAQNYKKKKKKKTQQNETKVIEGCRYRYPEEKQVEFILSNMMNELTLVFVKANKWLEEKIMSRKSNIPNADVIRRALESRFQVTHQKRKAFFEEIYFDMINEYRKFYNQTKVFRTGYDACKHQGEVKQLWQHLLERCLVTVKAAVTRCVKDYLINNQIELESELGRRVHTHLLEEIKEINTNMLKPLCDKYEMCYDHELKEFISKANYDHNMLHNIHTIDEVPPTVP